MLTVKDFFEIRIPANPKLMRLVRKTISQACELVGFTARESFAVTLAVDEGCTNIIRHCYGVGAGGEIVIRVRMYQDRIVILLRDFGGQIDLDRLRDCMEQRRRELDGLGPPPRPGGLGVMLIHSTMDRVHYRTSREAGSVLRLTKFLHNADRGGSLAGKGAS